MVEKVVDWERVGGDVVEVGVVGWWDIGKLMYVEKEIMSEGDVGVKVIGKVDVVEEIVWEMMGEEGIGKGSVGGRVVGDKERSGLVGMKDMDVEGVRERRREGGGGGWEVLSCKGGNGGKELREMVVWMGLGEVVKILGDRMKVGKVLRR